MKFGTILYRRGVDVLVSLSWALNAQNTSQEYTNDDHKCVHGPIVEDNKTVLHNAACIVNQLIHNEIERQSTVRQEFSTNPLSFSIEEELQNTNQLLVEFVDRITATVREIRHQTLRKESKASKQLKNVRMYNVLSLLQFCTNPNQPLLFHDLLADAVEMCGGSRELLKILNKLGCTSSPDTHDQFVAHHAAEQRKRYLWDDLSPSAFTIASVDNFDMLQSYSAVYCGNQHRSYHGTTVQIVQPSSNNNICQQASTSVPDVSPDLLHGASINSPDIQFHSSDISDKTGPKPKRQRTVEVRNLTSSLTSADASSNLYPMLLTMADFEESKEEADEQLLLSRELFSYILLKYTTHHDQDFHCTLSEMRCFLNDKGNDAVQPSQIHYMELINENPDSDDTMCIVAEDLLEKFDTEEQKGWVVLVGDGKTYQHLMNIKRQYGKALEKLIIFPGDWHILKNFQPILIKVYYNAGLRELAELWISECHFKIIRIL